ncbi:MAG: lipopolysaccharide biosynthesis protein [Phormidesmis sp.]
MSNFEQYAQANTSDADLKRRSLQSGLITFAAQPIKLVMGIGATAILARLVAPADFGLLAMVTPLLSLVDSLSNLGLETATVQQQNLTHRQASDAFWLSLKFNLLIISLMVAMAPVLAWFYGQKELSAITFFMAIGAFSLCLSFQHLALLKRQMRFNLLMTIEIISIAIATLCAILAAWLGLGYWALVLQVTVMQIVQSIAYWLTCDWRPSYDWQSLWGSRKKSHQISTEATTSELKDSTDSTRTMLSYGANLSGFRFITRIGMQMDHILVGYISGATALGFYDVAYRWAYFPFIQIYTPLFDVVISSLSRAYADPLTYRRYCRWALMSLFGLCLPSLAFLYVTAKDVLLILLGEQWLPAIPIFRLLLVAMFVGTLYRVTKWLYISSGETRRQLRWGLIHTPIMIASVAIGARWGAYGIAMGYMLGMCILTYPSVVFCLQVLPLTMADFFGAVWPAAIASLLSALALSIITPLLSTVVTYSLLKLCVQALLFGIAYCAIWFFLPGGKQSAAQAIANLKQLSRKV